MIDKYTLAYTAGYTDGDGCFHIRKTIRKSTGIAKYSCSFIISSTDTDIIEFLVKTFPGIRRIVHNGKRSSIWKPQHHFVIRGKKSIKFVQQILPFLIEKREEAEIYCKFIKSFSREEKEILMNRLKEVKNECNLVKKSHKNNLQECILTLCPSDLDFAYFAGFIDAECALGVFRYNSKNRDNFIYKILLQCGNTKLPIFKWLLERFGGQVHFVERRSKNINHRDFLTYRISSKSLGELLPRIFPYIKHKKIVCVELMKFYETTTPLQGNISRNSPKFKEFYADILTMRDTIFHKVHILNRKGI